MTVRPLDGTELASLDIGKIDATFSASGVRCIRCLADGPSTAMRPIFQQRKLDRGRTFFKWTCAMQIVNPAYAHPSSIGPVFDVATWVKPTWLSIGWLTAFALGLSCAGAAVYAAVPDVLGDPGPEWLLGLRELVEMGHRDHEAWMWTGVAGGLLGSYFFLAMCIADQVLRLQGEFFLRVGPGGISARLPGGISFSRARHQILEIDYAWSDVASWRVVQHKELGALSPNSGNLHADLILHLHDDTHHTIPLGYFREPARIIYHKMQDAVEMVPMSFEASSQQNEAPTVAVHDPLPDRRVCVSLPEEKQHEISGSLKRVLKHTEAFVIFSDLATDQFVQACDIDGRIWLELPSPQLDEPQWRQARDLLVRRGLAIDYEQELHDDESGWSSTRGASDAATRATLGVDLGNDTETAAEIVLEIFAHVFGAPRLFQLQIDEQSKYYRS